MFIFHNQTVLLPNREPMKTVLAAHDDIRRDGLVGTVEDPDRPRDVLHVVVYQQSDDMWVSAWRER